MTKKTIFAYFLVVDIFFKALIFLNQKAAPIIIKKLKPPSIGAPG